MVKAKDGFVLVWMELKSTDKEFGKIWSWLEYVQNAQSEMNQGQTAVTCTKKDKKIICGHDLDIKNIEQIFLMV